MIGYHDEVPKTLGYCHLAAITVDFLYGDAAPQVFFETTVEGDTLPNVVDHWEELEEGGERWTAVFRHAHLEKLEVMTCCVSLRYLHLASVDELQEPGGILEGDVRQEQHLVAPVLLLEQPLQRFDINLKFSWPQDLVHLEELGDGGNNGAVSEQDGGVAADEGQVTVAGKAKIAKIANIANIAKIKKIKKIAKFFLVGWKV